MPELRQLARQALLQSNLSIKLDLMKSMAQLFAADECKIDGTANFSGTLNPGRPALPELVQPRDVSQRGLSSVEGRAKGTISQSRSAARPSPATRNRTRPWGDARAVKGDGL